MFKIESYITPIILNYLAKYVKNIRPQDFQVSLWEGEVTFQNLDLRLDVLEQELNLPFEFLSGHIHELAIQVPWTKITSEPIKVLINTIEFVLKAKTVVEHGAKSSAGNSPQHSAAMVEGNAKAQRKDDDSSSMSSGLAMKIVNNINIQCQNIILKYVEEDIVVSMNVQYLSYCPANELWQPAMVDVNPHKVLMRKLINISDLTICLDRRNSAGQIDVCQEPVLYRCTLEIRFLRKYNSNTLATSSITRIGIFTQALDLNLSSLQIPMLMRLIKFLTSLSGDSDSEDDPCSVNKERGVAENSSDAAGSSYLSWAWNLLPSFTFEESDEVDSGGDDAPGHTKDVGIYVEELNFTLKNSEFINDAIMGGIKRIRYTPIVRFTFGGLYFERVAVKEIDWISTKAGLSSIYVEPLGQYRTEDNHEALALLETSPYTNMRSFIDKSLFDEQCMIADRGWGVTNYEDYVTRITDDYLIFRSPVFALDIITYRSASGSCESKDASNITTNISGKKIYDIHKQCRLLSSGITFRLNETFMQVKNIIKNFIDLYDSSINAYSSSNAEKIEIHDSSATTKLHPPLVEDYDALMQGVPLCKYKIDLKYMQVEIFAKTEPSAQSSRSIYRRLPSSIKNSLPFLLVNFDFIELYLTTPLNPDKLVHTTCQLPDKPQELLNACYDNYELNIGDFTLSLMSPSKDTAIRLVTIPKLCLSYGSLLQPYHWKTDEVSIKKIDLHCDQIRMDFSKRELFAALYLYESLWSYQPQLLIRVSTILNHPYELADSIALSCGFNKLQMKRRLYHTFDIWNAHLSAVTADVLMERKSVQVQRYNIFNTTSKMHNNQNKWLEVHIQYPGVNGEVSTSHQKSAKKEPKESINMAIGIWMEKFYFNCNKQLLDFLSLVCQEDERYCRDFSVESDVQSQTVQNPAVPSSHHTSSAHSTAYQTNPSMPQVFGRKSSRNSNSLRKISHPEETIHYSSEKDERIDTTTTETKPSDEEKIKNYFKKFNTIIIYMDIAQSQMDITTNHKYLSKDDTQDFTRFTLPHIILKSTFAEYITRSSLRLKVNPPLNTKTTFNWTIQFLDLSIATSINDQLYAVLQPWQTTVTVAMNKRKQNLPIPTNLSEYTSPTFKTQQQHTSPRSSKQKSKHPTSEHAAKSQDNSSVSSGSLKEIFSGSEHYKDSSSATPSLPKMCPKAAANAEGVCGGDKVQELICLNLHLDSSTVYMYVNNIKTLQGHFQHFMKIMEMSSLIVVGKRDISAGNCNKQPVKILTLTEDHHHIKEFMDLDSNSDISAKPTSEYKSLLNKLSLFCQWTVTKVIAEVVNAPEQPQRSKIILELEDFLCTLDQGQDFTKYTNKIGNFNLNYYQQKSANEWLAQERIRIRMIAETTDLPFLNIVLTKVCLRDFYKRIGVKRKGEMDRFISEIVVIMQAMEIIMDFDGILEFLQPLCALMWEEESATDKEGENLHEVKKIKEESIVKAADLPLVHFESKGITCYFPLANGIAQQQQCSVLICKIDSINITPNLQNPLQRKPQRPDVYGKAATMGILSIPGSMVEDRQYELTLRKFSAASGNWHEILTHMRNKDHNFHTNPAVEWNNPERKQSLRLAEIFKNFTLIVIYAPNIVYNNILICGEALEFNCSSDLLTNITTDQLKMFAGHWRKLQQISDTINNMTKRKLNSTSKRLSPYSKYQLETMQNLDHVGPFQTNLRHMKTEKQKNSTNTAEIRRFTRLGSASQFESIDEDGEPQLKTDSGVQSITSKPSVATNIPLDKFSQIYPNIIASHSIISNKRNLPKSISLLAGVFTFKIYDSTTSSHEDNLAVENNEGIGKPLMSMTISQPSFMITQNIYDSVVNFSVFNVKLFLPQIQNCNWRPQTSFTSPTSPVEQFCEAIIDTKPGELSSTGIPPALLTYKASQTKLKMLEIDIDLSKPLVLTLSQSYIEEMCKNLMIIYNSIHSQQTPQTTTCQQQPIHRLSKIMLMKANTLNADRLNIKCNNIALKLTNHLDYETNLNLNELKINLKYLTRPEKCSIKYSLAAVYLRTNRKIFLHPMSLKGSIDFVSEPWNRLPLVNVICKFNVIQIELGVSILQQMQQALNDLSSIAGYAQKQLQQFQALNLHDDFGYHVNRQILRQLKYPKVNSFVKSNKSLKREEFYQDDLRAGAFQFVELMSDAVLPLPYQVQIIKKDYGIICWRYPQPRKMCKIHIYPVPMAVSNPIHIRCRMEYFSEVHEQFLHFCDFWLSETNSKDIKLPEREICATIWRVVILQSLVSVDGECFDTSEEDEELQSISHMNIEEVLGKGRKDSDFMLHPKVLVACMRVDTTFQSKSVPKIQTLLSFNTVCVNLLNKPNDNDELPPMLRNYHLANNVKIPQAFLIFTLQNIKMHGVVYSRMKYNANLMLTAHIKYLDYGFLNMLPLLEETTVQTYLEMDQKKNVVNANFVFDRLRFNLGPSVLHTLLSSKLHWEECLDANERRIRHVLIPKCIVVNRTMTAMAFGQSGTHERIPLSPKECCMYSFRSDCNSQDLTLYISDEETNTVDTSESIHIPFKFESETMSQTFCIGSKCIIVKSKKLSGSQICVLIQGQIELISMVEHNLRLEFRQEGKLYDEANKPLEYFIERNGRNSFYYNVNRNSNISMRLRLADNKVRARTGDIPLKMNKKLPWLVKVPVNNNEFISFWVRILREDITTTTANNDSMQPQKILITIWPIFEITSRLNCAIQAKEQNTEQEFSVMGQGGQYILDASATHLTEHPLNFKYDFPLATSSQDNYTLRLRSLDWQKFFWYDEQKWTIENALNVLAKPATKNWPLAADEEELKVKRNSLGNGESDVIYNTQVSREFSCTLNLEIAPWGMFINGTGVNIQLKAFAPPATPQQHLQQHGDGKHISIAANNLEMLFNISQGFVIGIQNSVDNWNYSLPIFFENALSNQCKRYYVLTEGDITDIVILRGKEVFKFAENVTRSNIQRLNEKTPNTEINSTSKWNSSIGLSLTTFYDINYESAQRSVDTAFVYFVIIKMLEDSEVSIPIPLALPFNRKCISVQRGNESYALVVSLIEHDGLYYLCITEDLSPAVLVNNQTDCAFIVAQTNASENSKVSSTTPEYDGKHLEWYHMIPKQSKCYYTPPEWYTRFPEVDSTLCNITLALYDDTSTKKTIKWSKPIRLDKTWKKFLHIPGHGDVKVIICDKHRVIRLNIYYISQQMEFSVKDLRLRLSTTEPKTTDEQGNLDPKPPSDSTITKLYTETPQFSKPDVCHHFRNECESRPNTKVRLFIKEIVLSLHTDSPQRQYMKQEVVSLYADDFVMAYDDSEDERLLSMAIPNLQIDNQLFSTGKYDFPVILCAQDLYQRNDMLPEPYYLGSYYKYLLEKSPMIKLKLKLYEDEFKICSLKCHFNPIRAYIEDAYITDFLDALVECEPSNCAYRPKPKIERIELVGNQMCVPNDVASAALYTAEPLQLRQFCIEPMSVLLSVHTSVRLYIALDHSPLSFSLYERSHLLTMPMKFGQSLGMHYLSGAIFGAGWVVGSLEILGSPSGLARSVTTGLKDFVSLPVRGLFRGPWGFIVGITQGSASLLRNVTAGTVNSVTKLAASVARNLDRLTLDEEHIERTEALRRSRPQGFTEGLSQGMTGLGISMLGAVGGLAHHTLEARSTVEVFTGLSKGLVGAFTKPISGAAELLALAGQGMLQTVGFNAMPKQRSPSTSRNLSLEPSGYRTWKILPIEMSCDQILFYHEVTLAVEEHMKRGYVFLTSRIFAIIEAETSRLLFALPLDKVQVTADANDKTKYYVRLTREREDIEEDADFTNERIMNFLHTSSIKITSDSLFSDLLQHNATHEPNDIIMNSTSNYKRTQTLDWTFYISEHLGEYILRYFKILNTKYLN
ncbi:intermembrane lipid transfer protein VPS13B [Musca vetustissima]|uniref:intermembrane lipid transfer protein VPS13B n=1 Tax=Musca vetustissima TaxID=27455 RepID=UPI002AB66B73|nr:intermembrane lipid transfer protein VPS13B [Musca vetustissima]